MGRNRKGFAPLILIAIIAAVALAGAGVWYFGAHRNTDINSTGCPTDMKRCPDGSSVGRIGPHCEFGVCQEPSSTAPMDEPTSTADIPVWKTFVSQPYGFQFKYPNIWTDAGRSVTSEDYFTKSPQVEIFEINSFPLIKYGLMDNASFKNIANGIIKDNNCPGDHIINSDNNGALFVLNCSVSSEVYNYVFRIPADGTMAIMLSYHDDFSESLPEGQKILTLNQIIQTIQFVSTFTPRGTGAFCGGIAAGAFQCSMGYTCVASGTYPDAGGTCQIQKVTPPAGTMCAQHVVTAKNTATGEVHDFPTPCQVPKGWVAAGAVVQ